MAVLILLSACSYPTRNQRAAVVDEEYGYRWKKLAGAEPDDTLVVVTASGGGTRAAALELSVLRGLDRIVLPSGKTLAEKVDLISSVSGGSVTAAYFALRGREGFDQLEHNFIRKSGIAALVAAAVNPVGLVELATPSKERIDLLADYLDDELFKGATFETLENQKRRPYLVLNAADMVEGVPFSFTQRKFNLLCSDLSPMRLSMAVSASAAFPVLLTPVTLTNYSPCPATLSLAHWPPEWVTVNVDDQRDAFKESSLWYDNPQRTMLGRTEYAYAMGDDPSRSHPKLYIHLLDGGIADNLGIFEPFRMLTTQDTQPSLLSEINQGRYRRLVFIVVNARSFSESNLDEEHATPGTLDMLEASLSAPIDRATAGTASQLRTLLLSEFRQMGLRDAAKEAIFHVCAENTVLISVDFDAIADDRCRQKFQSIPTSWTLEPEQIDGLLEVGEALLGNDPAFGDLLGITGGALRQPLPTLGHACELETNPPGR